MYKANKSFLNSVFEGSVMFIELNIFFIFIFDI